MKKLKQKTNGFSDPFEDNDDDVARIAKELERKYGNAYVSGRGKNKRDEIDIGLGYDESDSFIDNTEAVRTHNFMFCSRKLNCVLFSVR